MLVAFIGSVGCSSSDPLDKAAAPTVATDKQPPAIPGKRPHRAPPIAGPNAGKDIFAGRGGSAPSD